MEKQKRGDDLFRGGEVKRWERPKNRGMTCVDWGGPQMDSCR